MKGSEIRKLVTFNSHVLVNSFILNINTSTKIFKLPIDRESQKIIEYKDNTGLEDA